jgi:hypothetical protein
VSIPSANPQVGNSHSIAAQIVLAGIPVPVPRAIDVTQDVRSESANLYEVHNGRSWNS